MTSIHCEFQVKRAGVVFSDTDWYLYRFSGSPSQTVFTASQQLEMDSSERVCRGEEMYFKNKWLKKLTS